MADIGVDKHALADYAAKASTLAGEIGTVASSGLAEAQSVPGNAFGEVGQETGLPAAISGVVSSITSSVGQVSAGLSGLSSAVSRALADYEHMDEQNATTFNTMAT